MIVYFDTVRRKRPVRKGGDLVKLDWASKEVLETVPIYPTDPDILDDPNPRGNSRGGKGIIVAGEEILVGSYHTILVFDPHLNLLRRMTNNLFVNIHEMCRAGDNIWVSSTAIDCAILVDGTGAAVKTWWPREEPILQERYGLFPMEIDKNADNRLRYLHEEPGQEPGHTHLNGLARYEDRTYALLNRQGVLVQFEPKTRIVMEDRLLKGGHSPVVSPDGKRILVCSSFHKSVLVIDIDSGRMLERITLLEFPEIEALHLKHPDEPYNKSIFVRGLEIITDGRILVGISPAAILEIDLHAKKLLDFYLHSSDVGDAVHGLSHCQASEEG